MFYLDNVSESALDEYFIGEWDTKHFKWYARIQESIGHDSSEYDFRYKHDLRLWCMATSGDQSLSILHEDERYVIYRSIDQGITVDIILNKNTGQHTGLELFQDDDDAINIEV